MCSIYIKKLSGKRKSVTWTDVGVSDIFKEVKDTNIAFPLVADPRC